MTCLDCHYLKVDFPKPFFCNYRKIYIPITLAHTIYFCFDCEIYKFSDIK